MIGVNKIEDIRRMRGRGESVAAIARATGVSEPTDRKRGAVDDLSRYLAQRDTVPHETDAPAAQHSA